ncbi:type I phosphomannose isomerase catalytic subunit [Coraliomargarita akajimensis]|uniref:Mannose-6-phosphate isomerase n=1 Tax=Coraliomargarita akajimensis (strain DSM 45221 / IAM 15411 / JCM 23193 / KCTC 12865 / 04OKA010-24) TaxID=583355 RepID=D5ELD6_CORAD|nr:type I phosphomannose isomerase catalytic subunit [Coraliomargarita akajimensis]ADE55072.1 Mannose-6-phosphate isomerase [Coraliomargarita akajimensis DSM 45221]
MQLILFSPLYMERVWGGRGLESKLGRTLPANQIIGESWELVDRTEAQSVVANGEFAGSTIRQLLESQAEAILGPGTDSSAPFPILVKWLDCQDRLSLQVHPPADIAPSLGGEPKTENWYIADCDADASLIVGLKNGVTREQFETALRASEAESCVHRFPVKPGDSILVESGRMHAIDAGNLILEIQQNSDTTYRVYDWGRVGLDGRPRDLHVEESLKSIDWTDFEPSTLEIVPGEQVLADCAEFRIRKFELKAGDELELPRRIEARLLHIVTGQLKDRNSGTTLQRGDNALQPYVTGVQLLAESDSTLLVTDHF